MVYRHKTMMASIPKEASTIKKKTVGFGIIKFNGAFFFRLRKSCLISDKIYKKKMKYTK